MDILHRVGIKSSSNEVYKALTAREGLAAWWTNDTQGESKVGGDLKFRFSSDGKEIGTVITTGFDEDNEPVLVAEIAQPLGIGTMAVAVPTSMFVRKGDRVELTLTEAEVNARLKR